MRNPRGFAIPVSLCVAGVVLFLGGSIAQLAAGDLQLANHEFYQERARQAADFGLESGIADQLKGNFSYTYQGISGCNSGDSAQVVIYDNQLGTLPSDSGCPVSVPKGFQYWVSTGQAKEGSRICARVRAGALVRWGMPMGSAGAQVRYLHADSGQGPVRYRAVDRDNHQISEKILCATESSNADLPSPNPAGLVSPVTFNSVEAFEGKMRIPQGADLAQVVQATFVDPKDSLAYDASGGFFNVPNYSPPVSNKVSSDFDAPAGVTNLPPGLYDQVKLPGKAELNLKGVYHFKRLVLEPGNVSSVGRLTVGETGAAHVFIDEIVNPGDVRLGLINLQAHANVFRLNLKPPSLLPGSASTIRLEVNAHAAGTGGVTVIAPKQHLKVFGASDRLIRGSFCCETLSLAFDNNGAADKRPTFIYDTSSDTSRDPDSPKTQFQGVQEADGISPPLNEEYTGASRSQPMILSKVEL